MTSDCNNVLIKFINCRLVRNHQLINDDLWIRNGKIIDPEPVFYVEKVVADKQIDCKNAIISAGFIDLQINGGFGVDFSSDLNSIELGMNKVGEALIKTGVTSFCPTIVSSPTETYQQLLSQLPNKTNGAGILGLHLEGPFINPLKKGAHPQDCLKTLDNDMENILSTYGTLDNVKIITLAPELDKTGTVIRKLTEKNITVALGHSMANLKTAEDAIKNGASLVTHLYNAMLPFHHRDPGLIGLLASDAAPNGQIIYFGIIADGVHTTKEALRIAYRSNPDGLILVTDAISAMGLEEGIHQIGQLKLQVSNGMAFIAGSETLCGSIAPMDKCVKIFQKATKCSIAYALEAASLHPAKCLKIEKSKGTLDFESDADFVIVDDNLNILSTWIAGECVYRSECLQNGI